jgi:hypothetical protein
MDTPSQSLPIITTSRQPLELHRPDFSAPQTEQPELQSYDTEHMGGITLYQDIWHDPTLPLEQSVQVNQDIWLTERPGELASQTTESNPQAESDQQRSEPYPRPWFADGPDNSRRGRHQSLLNVGLESERR